MAVNSDTIGTVQNILAQKASAATIANGFASASQGDVRSATISALQSVEAFAAVIGKTVKGVAPGLGVASLTNNLDLPGFHFVPSGLRRAAPARRVVARMERSGIRGEAPRHGIRDSSRAFGWNRSGWL